MLGTEKMGGEEVIEEDEMVEPVVDSLAIEEEEDRSQDYDRPHVVNYIDMTPELLSHLTSSTNLVTTEELFDVHGQHKKGFLFLKSCDSNQDSLCVKKQQFQKRHGSTCDLHWCCRADIFYSRGRYGMLMGYGSASSFDNLKGSLSDENIHEKNKKVCQGIIMGHRHLSSTSQMFEIDHDQNQNHLHAEQPYAHLGRASAVENGSSVYPMENMSTGGVHFSSHWNSAPRSNEYSSSSLSMEVPHYQPATSGPCHDPFLHSAAPGSFFPVLENCSHYAPSSSYYRHTIHGVEGGVIDPSMGSGRGAYKRKSPEISAVCERGSTSRYYSAGSSSNLSISSDLQQEKPSLDSQHWPRDAIGTTPSYRGSNLSIAGEGSLRNVRSRSTLDLEANLARTHISSHSSRHPHLTSHLIDHSGTVDLAGPSANAPIREWNHIPVSPAYGRILVSDTSGLIHETNQLLVGGSATNGPIEIGRYHHDFIPSRNPVVPPPNLHAPPTRAVRGGRSSYSQRAMPTYRATSSYPQLGNVATPSEDGLQLGSENHRSRHLRPVSTAGWRNGDRNGRSRMSYGRFRSLSDEADAHDRLVSEALLMVDRSVMYGSRNLFDQHRDMRLDIDNMSYEELLALGERIGNVSTGLSEDLISKCLMETVNCSSDQIQEEGNCSICLEQYKNREEVGVLKCGHDYHAGCIKKWLLIKNVCPICKAPALADDLKEK
ncbi:hypothetical protein HHK36_019145 [Tetracentron sinense]|uniref:RING-type E3 ubiquitin transferase n=1 Tax=Tetracentron sinense TaxID=13715 RepID=A0A834YVP7_TETSI|nr:hypothetical protein HHK36_019145 [Tetracentron sinense]